LLFSPLPRLPNDSAKRWGRPKSGRELGDAGGPLLVAAISAASTLSLGLLGAAMALLAAAVIAPAGFSSR